MFWDAVLGNPSDQVYIGVPVQSGQSATASPSPPIQEGSTKPLMFSVTALGELILTSSVAVQSLASVTVTV